MWLAAYRTTTRTKMENTNLIRPDFGSVPAPATAPRKRMLEVRLRPELNGYDVYINASSLAIILTCPRKARYALHEQWAAKAPGPPLVFGTAIHKGLEVFYAKPYKERGTLPATFEEEAHVIAQTYDGKAHDWYWLYDAITAFRTAVQPIAHLPASDKRSVAAGVWTLCHYFRTYWNDPYTTYVDSEGPFIERRFETLLTTFWLGTKQVNVHLHGQIDFVLENQATGEMLPGDHKTSSTMGTDFLNRIKPNHQYTGYLIGAQALLGRELQNFMVNGVQVKSIPVTSRGKLPTLIRQITRRTDEDIAEFRDAVEWAVRSYIGWMETDVWPLGNVDACANYGGCAFLDVCGAPNELRQNILEAKYERPADA